MDRQKGERGKKCGGASAISSKVATRNEGKNNKNS